VTDIHRRLCESARCPHLDTLNYSDPCIGCPEGHFGPYMGKGCDGPQIMGAPEFTPKGALKGTFPVRLPKPGDMFSMIILKLTGQRTANCGVCGERKRQMNEWRWWGCWKHRHVIVGWMVEEARKRGHEIDNRAMYGLFVSAVKEVRNQKKQAYGRSSN